MHGKRAGVILRIMRRHRADLRGSIALVTHISHIGSSPDRVEQLPAGSHLARVVRVDRGRLTVLTDVGERRVRPGNGEGLDAPAVGDWVAVQGERAVAVLPRRTAFTRTVAGRTSAAQVVAANVDLVLVVEALTGAPRIRRVERYLAVAWGSGATPVVVLTKADLCDDVAAAIGEVVENAPAVDVLAVSALTGFGVGPLRDLLSGGRTGALVGPSGAGKSSLVNALTGHVVAGTAAVRDSDGRGRHTTTARQLHVLPGGGALVDTPGLRELALYDDADGVDAAFADIAALTAQCRFRDCAHRTEPGCAVAAVIDDGRLDPARYTAWRKLQAEAHRQLLRVDARARAKLRRR